MHIETIKTQMKIAELIHNDVVKCQHIEETGDGLDNCWHRARYVTQSAFFLGKLMPVIFQEMISPARRAKVATTRELVAQQIEAELVCCDIYELINGFDFAAHGMSMEQFAQTSPQKVASILGVDFHNICHWGGYAAAIARREGL